MSLKENDPEPGLNPSYNSPKLQNNSTSERKRFLSRIWNKISGQPTSLKDSITEVIEEHDQNSNGLNYEIDEAHMLRNVLSFNELKVEDVMVPRSDIIWLNNDASLSDIKKKIDDKVHTRMPICCENVDDVLGFLHMKDVVKDLLNDSALDIEKLTRKILFVPPSMQTSVLLLKMQADGVHMAIVIDEYGGTTGLVTLEDLMEEIVGEIRDEHDIDEEQSDAELCVATGDNLYDVSARIEVEQLMQKTGINIEIPEDADYDTLGGMIIDYLNHVPVVGELITFDDAGVEFRVTQADPRRIIRATMRVV